MSIRSLPSEVVDQIAAGEVVERPAHLVKELVENSLDAKASMIEVEFDQGGRRVRVTDNGAGIVEQELPLALARHATSKIREAADLWRLDSFGFRGEALASIAAVSRVTLTSRMNSGLVGKRETGSPPKEEIGEINAFEADATSVVSSASRVIGDFGKLGQVERAGGNPGTSILIEELFANVPARLKFLKSESAEAAQIKTVLRALALVHSQVEFRLKSAGKLLQVWTKSPSFRERVEQVLDTKPLFENRVESNGMTVHAVFASPHNVAGNARQIWLFAQDRWIQDRGLQAAVMDAYRGLLMHGEFPIVCVRVSCAPDEIDVNIHPTKSAVKFRDSQRAFRAVQRCLREGLERAPWLQSSSGEHGKPSVVQAPSGTSYSAVPLSFHGPELDRTQYQKRDDHLTLSEATGFARASDVATASTTLSSVRSVDALTTPLNVSPGSQPQSSSLSPDADSLSYVDQSASVLQISDGQGLTPTTEFVRPASRSARETVREGTSYWGRLQVLGQAHLTYILAETNEKLFLIDQHAAHERVAYERLMSAWQQGRIDQQKLLIPLTVEMEVESAEALAHVASDLARIGVDVEPFGPGAVVVRALPNGIKESALADSLVELGREIAEKGGGFALERKISDLCATVACHSVVRAGQALNTEQMKSLLVQMDEFPLSSFCPHGRPVSIEYPFTKLERDFGRLV